MNWINASRWGTAGLAVLVGFNLVGCGGGGGDSDPRSDNSPGQTVEAPVQIGGNNVTFHSGTLGERTVTFNADNTSWSQQSGGTNANGAYQYRRQDDARQAEIVFNEQGQEATILLTFSSENSGSFAYRDNRDSGTFEMHRINNGQNPDPLPNDGLAPSSLAGRTMYGTRTYTSTGPKGQTHTYTFTVNTFHDSDPPEESDGAYLYNPSGNTATLQLNYYSPAGFNGDKHELAMTFHTETAGAFESQYTRRDGTVIQINGTFTIE